MLTVYLQILQLSYRPVSSAINLASNTIICDYDATVIDPCFWHFPSHSNGNKK